jgi:hypothetical protein
MIQTPTLSFLRREEIEGCCDPHLHVKDHLDILWWLIWLPLLTRDELARVTKRNPSTLWSQLTKLAQLGLVEHVSFNEAGWVSQHHYYLTDLGLYVLATLDEHPLSVYKLAVGYPITRPDLLERLARPRVHLALAELVTRFIAEHPPGYRLTSYQQPFKEKYADRSGKNHLLRFDAALLLARPEGTQHAFYVRVDQPEHMLSQREVKSFVQHLLDLRQARHFVHEIMPHFLLISSQERFAFWAEQVNRVTLAQGIALLDVSKPEPAREHMDLSCAIADATDLGKGIYEPLWTPFHALIKQDGAVKKQTRTSICSFLDRVASPHLIERFSRYFSFQRALTTDPRVRRKDQLPCYVNITLHKEAEPLVKRAAPGSGKPEIPPGESATQLSDDLFSTFYSGPEDRLTMSALLTLALSDQQKEIITHLARHPYLSPADLLSLLHPGQHDERLLSRQIMPLIHLQLVNISIWDNAPTSSERFRYCLREPALRWLACRHGLSPAYYLDLSSRDQQHRKQQAEQAHEENQRQPPVSPLSIEVTWVQRSIRGLWGENGCQMFHTSGIYRCVCAILEAASHETYHIVYWKSAHESSRPYRDLLEPDRKGEIRPDAELLYTTPTRALARSLLIEYDRDTTNLYQLCRKFRCYTEYQYDTRSTLPTTLVITQNQQAMDKIQKARTKASASDVDIIIALEEHILRYGLTHILPHLHGK